MAKYELITGVRHKALRVGIYGQPGIGKTTLAAEFPNPVYIDVEDGSNQLPVARLPRPTSWSMLLDEVREVRDGNVPCSTLVIDTADAAETLCIRHVCSEHNWKGLESPGYGKGYTYAAEEFGKLLDLLGEVVDGGRNVVVVAHATARKFERPDEEGAYDRYEPKLSKKVAPMYKEWCDMLLFCDYKTYVETESNKDGKVVKAKAKGGRRIIRTTHHPCWDAKNRFGLKDELPLSYDGIAECVPDMQVMGGRTVYGEPTKDASEPEQAQDDGPEPVPDEEQAEPSDPRDAYPPRMRALVDLMRADGITDEMLCKAMGAKGFVPEDAPVANYQQKFVDGIIASWANFVKFAREID